MTKKEQRAADRLALDSFVRGRDTAPGKESRALGEGSPVVTQTQSVQVQAAFYRQLLKAMRAYDSFFDPSVTTFVSAKNGSSMLVPTIDDTANAATVVAEGAQDAETDPTTGAVLLQTASNFRTGMVTISLELLQDSAFDPAEWLAQSFAIRLARGIGSSIVSAALAGASSGATGSSATTVVPDDVLALIKSIDPAYLESPKAGLAMNFSTLLAIRGGKTSTGAYILPSDHPEIFGLPVFICPSMPSIAASATPVIAGDFGYLAVRTVEGGTNLARFDELYAETGQVGFRGFLRASSALAVPGALKFLTLPS